MHARRNLLPAPEAVVMIRPHRVRPTAQTAEVAFDAAVAMVRAEGLTAPVFEADGNRERRVGVIDYSGLENDGLSPEGTGTMVLGHVGPFAAYLPLVPLNEPTIECAGGSVRCMIAGIHLTPRPSH